LLEKTAPDKGNVYENKVLSLFIDICSPPKLHSEGENYIKNYVF